MDGMPLVVRPWLLLHALLLHSMPTLLGSQDLLLQLSFSSRICLSWSMQPLCWGCCL